MALDLMNKSYELLESHPGDKFTTREIANWIYTNYEQECLEKMDRTSVDTVDELIAQLSNEISAHKRVLLKRKNISFMNTRPMKFSYIENEEIDKKEITVKSEDKKKHKFSEKDMYPLLSKYLHDELSVYSLRVDEKKSSNSKGQNGNKWLFPDVVGVEDIGEDWQSEIKDFAKVYPENRMKLWSFEVKLEINRTNIRECFFQSVSNSSWANLGYLVTAEITGIDTIKELRILSAAHGIGIILFDLENLENCEIIIPAHEKSSLEWEIMNRLSQENKDFKKYIENIKEFCQIGKIKDSDWDCSDK